MTDGIASTNEAERSSVPPASSWTTSAFSPSTRHTARRRPTVVRGSYVTLSSNTRRTPPPTLGVLCQAQPNGLGWQSLTLSAPQQLHCQPRGPQPGSFRYAPKASRGAPRPLPEHVPGAARRVAASRAAARRVAASRAGSRLAAMRSPAPRGSRLCAHQRLAVFADGEDIAMPPGYRVAERPGRPHHDLRAVLTRHAEYGVPAQPERLLRLVGLEPALGEAERSQRPVQDLLRRVQPQRPGERPLRTLGVPERDQRIALVEEELTLGVAERCVATFAFGQPGQRVMGVVDQARDAP